MSKRPKNPWPKGPYVIGTIGDVVRILDATGNDVLRDPEGIARLVECANACNSALMWFPESAIPALKEAYERMAERRSEAWARAQELQAIVDGSATQ